MRRRTFFKSVASSVALILVPKWARAAWADSGIARTASLQDLAVVVLPQSLGAKRIAETTSAFETWISHYPAGADAGYGYGHPHPMVLGSNPSLHYGDQLKQLEIAAAAGGSSFAASAMQTRRALVQSALAQAGVITIPPRPNGEHIATDLMSYFYGSSDGKDFRYNLAIRESDCRGLASSGERPPAFS
jgi:hypothetical protein